MYPYDDTKDDYAANSNEALKRLVDDPLYWREQDPEYRSYVDDSFKTVYGGEAAEQDATGRIVEPEARPAALPPFRPTARPDDTEIGAGVGESQPNGWRDVFKVQKGLANTGHYTLDMRKEKSGEHSPNLAQAIRDFQREKREEIDGVLLPGGPTMKRLGETLFNSPKLPPSGVQPRQTSSDDTVTMALAPKNRTDIGHGTDLGVQTIAYRPKQAPPAERRDAGTGTAGDLVPSEIHNPNDWGESRAVIVDMPNGNAYIMLEPVGRDQRRPGTSDFIRRDGNAAHHYTFEQAKSRFGFAVPMTEEQAAEVQQRIARGERVTGYEPHLASRPIGTNHVYIVYYQPDGSIERTVARHNQSGRYLYAPGNEHVEIAAHDAVKMGLQDWMRIQPPAFSSEYPLPTIRDLHPIRVASYLARMAAYWDDQDLHSGRQKFFAKAPNDAKPTWR